MRDLFLRMLAFSAVFLPIYCVLRAVYHVAKNRGRPLYMPREVLLCLFSCFMAGLMSLVFQPGVAYNGIGSAGALQRLTTGEDINLLPFYTIIGFFWQGNSTRFIINIIANILIFSPIGFFLPLLWKRWQKGWKVILCGGMFSLIVECTQLFIGRSVDVDDLILNSLGVAIGYLLFKLFSKTFPAVSKLAV